MAHPDPSSTRHLPWLLLLLSSLLFAASGCATSASVADAGPVTASHSQGSELVTEPTNDAIVAIHRSKCGACHMPVAPGSLARTTAEAAMLRHRRRAKLTERQWTEMVDYLSEDGALHARHTAQLP